MRTSYLVLYRLPCLKVVMVQCSLREESINIYFLVQSRRSVHLACRQVWVIFWLFYHSQAMSWSPWKKEAPHYGLFCFVWLLFFLLGNSCLWFLPEKLIQRQLYWLTVADAQSRSVDWLKRCSFTQQLNLHLSQPSWATGPPLRGFLLGP